MIPTRAEVRAWLAERMEESNHWISELFLRANRFDAGADDRRYWHREAALARAALAALDDAERMDRLDEIQDGWVSFRRHLDAWLLEASRHHGRGKDIREAIDHVTLRPQLEGEA